MRYFMAFSLAGVWIVGILIFGCESPKVTSLPKDPPPLGDTLSERVWEIDTLTELVEEEPQGVLLDRPLFPANRYPAFRQELADSLANLRKTYALADSSEKLLLLKQAGSLLEYTLTERYFPCWYGTPWDFNGYSARPQEGAIACGYFVSTPLRHAGFRLNRYRMAQQGAYEIIKSLSGEAWSYRNIELSAFVSAMMNQPEGLYVVGLDYHVGWLHRKEDALYFIHSTFVAPGAVMLEEAAHSLVLENSSIRVVGAISSQPVLMDLWLRNDTVRLFADSNQ